MAFWCFGHSLSRNRHSAYQETRCRVTVAQMFTFESIVGGGEHFFRLKNDFYGLISVCQVNKAISRFIGRFFRIRPLFFRLGRNIDSTCSMGGIVSMI